jgi:hypothetical protein
MLEMRRARLTLIPLLVILLVAGLAGTALAESTNNPQWSLCKAKEKGKFAAGCEAAGSEFEQITLAEGEKEEITGTISGAAELQTTAGTILAKKAKLKSGANLKGSKMPNPGTGEEVIEYEEVSVKGAPSCKIEQGKEPVTTIKTAALTNKQAFATKTGAVNEEGLTLTIVEPATGKTLMEVELVGSCPTTGPVRFEGSIALEDVEGAKYKESHELKGPAAPIKTYFVNEAGKTVEKTTGLTANGTKAAFIIIFIIVLIVLLLWATPAR